MIDPCVRAGLSRAFRLARTYNLRLLVCLLGPSSAPALIRLCMWGVAYILVNSNIGYGVKIVTEAGAGLVVLSAL